MHEPEQILLQPSRFLFFVFVDNLFQPVICLPVGQVVKPSIDAPSPSDSKYGAIRG